MLKQVSRSRVEPGGLFRFVHPDGLHAIAAAWCVALSTGQDSIETLVKEEYTWGNRRFWHVCLWSGQISWSTDHLVWVDDQMEGLTGGDIIDSRYSSVKTIPGV